MGKSLFRNYRAREKSVERVISASGSRAGRRLVERVLDLSFEVCPPPTTLPTTTRRVEATLVGRVTEVPSSSTGSAKWKN